VMALVPLRCIPKTTINLGLVDFIARTLDPLSSAPLILLTWPKGRGRFSPYSADATLTFVTSIAKEFLKI